MQIKATVRGNCGFRARYRMHFQALFRSWTNATSHPSNGPQQKEKAGIGNNLLRRTKQCIYILWT
jgi:hypothetical protein